MFKVKEVKTLVWGYVCNLKKAGGQLQVRKAPKKDIAYIFEGVNGLDEVMNNVSQGGLTFDSFKWVFVVQANADKKRIEPVGIALVTCHKRSITNTWLEVTAASAAAAEGGTSAQATGSQDQQGEEEEEDVRAEEEEQEEEGED